MSPGGPDAGRASLLLALDTSGDELVVAVLRDLRLAGCACVPGGRHQAHVVEAVEAALAGARLEPAALTAIAVVTGPGSHTGLRVGLSTAAGLAYARRLPIWPLGSLDVAAHRASPGAGPVLAAVGAGRGRVHARLYSRDGGRLVAAGSPRLGLPAEVADVAGVPVVGDAAILDAARAAGLPAGATRPGCEALAAVVAEAVHAGEALAYDQLRGRYQ